MRRPQKICLVHVTDHYLVFSKEHPFLTCHCAIYTLRQMHFMFDRCQVKDDLKVSMKKKAKSKHSSKMGATLVIAFFSKSDG